ncbi:Ig-like domain-containing protein [Haloferula sp. BvORR071]|uniref:Ig-like domain-containing protein n=1 Tax=Haloferula sp. BvORR071 TaxID=1396141 RepID=UPI00054E7729|nr:Ig-like domain-containing protein [Haloferula sp. BvORR071]
MNSTGFLSKVAGPLLAAFSTLSVASADQPPMTAAQVAQLAYNQGFRGGSLMTAVAVASAESSFDPDAVCNSLQEINSSDQPLFYPNGKPRMASLPYYDGTMLPVGQILNLSGGGRGKVVSHCRGLWQINDVVHSTITNADAFDPTVAVRRAWGISRGGRFWGKWTSVMQGTAWQPARLSAARTAARAVDPTVLPTGVAAGTRVRAWTTGGGIRTTAGGTFNRSILTGDTGTILAGPTIASITEGIQTSQHLWYQIQWDHGITGWSVEEYLTQSTLPVQNASPASNPLPTDGKTRVPLAGVALEWTVGGNTKDLQLRFGTDPALTAAGTLKLNGGLPRTWNTGALVASQNYYWRIDSVSGNGTVVQGSTWTFRSMPPAPQPVVLSNLTVTPKPAGKGQMLTIKGTATSPGPQPVIIGANVGNYTDAARDLVFSVPGGNVPTQFTRSFQLPADIPFGSYDLIVAAWQDADGSGAVESGDAKITQLGLAAGVVVGDVTLPTLNNLSVSPVSALPNQAIQLSATASDSGGSGLAGVYFYRATGEASPGVWQVVAYRPATGNGPVTLTAQDMPGTEARYWYEMEAVDLAGNRYRLAAPSTVRIQIPDLAPPVAKWQQPQNGMTIGGGITVTGEATDDRALASVYYRVNGGAWVQVFQNFNNWSFLLNPLPGSNLIETMAIDQVGKTSAIEPLYLYNPGSNGDNSVFEELINFDNQTLGQRWQVDPEFVIDSGIVNGRLQASANNSALIRATKTVPAGIQTVELRFGADGDSGVYWRDNAFRWWRVALKQNPTRLEVGFDGSLQTVSVPNGSGQLSKIRTLWRDGRIALEFYAGGQQQATTQTLSLPLLKLANLSGTMEFRTQGSSFSSAYIDDIQLRALRPWDRFSIDSQTLKSGQTSKVRWTSFNGRNYSIELSPTMANGAWTTLGQAFGNGLVTEYSFSMPAGPRRFVRVRELP